MILNFLKNIKFKKKERPIPLSSGIIHKILFFNEIINKIKNIEGKIVECGVGWGRSAFIISELSFIHNLNKKIILCDTFNGFPKLSEKDMEIDGIFKGYYKAPKLSVSEYFKNSKMSNFTNIEYKIGDIKETLKNFNEDISLLNLDLDIYSSYDFALSKLLDKVVSGGIIIIDEYYSKKWANIKDLVDKYMKNKNYKLYKSNFCKFNRVYFLKL